MISKKNYVALKTFLVRAIFKPELHIFRHNTVLATPWCLQYYSKNI